MNALERVAADIAGETEVTVEGRTFRFADAVTLRLAGRPNPYDRTFDGRSATIERIFLDYESEVAGAVPRAVDLVLETFADLREKAQRARAL